MLTHLSFSFYLAIFLIGPFIIFLKFYKISDVKKRNRFCSLTFIVLFSIIFLSRYLYKEVYCCHARVEDETISSFFLRCGVPPYQFRYYYDHGFTKEEISKNAFEELPTLPYSHSDREEVLKIYIKRLKELPDENNSILE